jgi:hypothetical protein
MPCLFRISPRFEAPSNHAAQAQRLYAQQQRQQLFPNFSALFPYKKKLTGLHTQKLVFILRKAVCMSCNITI